MSEIINKSIDSKELTAWVIVKDAEGIALGYVYDTFSEEQQTKFIQVLEGGIETWLEKMRCTQLLRLSFQHAPVSIDPRLGGDEISSSFLKMLFEGLTRIGKMEKSIWRSLPPP